MMKRCFNSLVTSVFIAATVLPSVAFAQAPTVYDIESAAVTKRMSGDCKVDFILANNYSETLEISGKAFFVNEDRMTVGDANVFFSPALPSGKSAAQAIVYSRALVGGSCPSAGKVILSITYCPITGGNTKLMDGLCNRQFSFDFSFK